jgi:putative hemolysin
MEVRMFEAARTIISHKIRSYKPSTNVLIENSRVIIKTVSAPDELKEVLEFRHEIYYKELLNTEHPLKLDVDRFDFKCDHLIVIDKATNKIVGTYRLNSSLFNDDFYSATEFNITDIVKLKGVKLEIGRAGVHPDFRNAATIAMLWKGILEYMKMTDTKWLFGCSSIKTTDTIDAVLLFKKLNKMRSPITPVNAKPKRQFKVPHFERYIEQYYFGDEKSEKDVDAMIPPLLKFYIKSGAQICGEPALDREFKCLDFLTLLNVDRVSERLNRKFSA